MTSDFAMKRKLTDDGLYILALSDIIKNNKRERCGERPPLRCCIAHRCKGGGLAPDYVSCEK